MTLWELVTTNSTLSVQAGNTFWDHVNNQRAGVNSGVSQTTLWEVVTNYSALPVQPETNFWEHLNNQNEPVTDESLFDRIYKVSVEPRTNVIAPSKLSANFSTDNRTLKVISAKRLINVPNDRRHSSIEGSERIAIIADDVRANSISENAAEYKIDDERRLLAG